METLKKAVGRPKKPDSDLLVQKSIRMTPAQWEKIDGAGIDALRALVDKWKPKTTQGTLRVPRS